MERHARRKTTCTTTNGVLIIGMQYLAIDWDGQQSQTLLRQVSQFTNIKVFRVC